MSNTNEGRDQIGTRKDGGGESDKTCDRANLLGIESNVFTQTRWWAKDVPRPKGSEPSDQEMSSQDAKNGYWSVTLDNESSPLTTFNSPFGIAS